MVLKCRIMCKYPADEEDGVYGSEQWRYIGGITEAAFGYDRSNKAVIAELEFENKPPMTIALYDEAYLLNENGKTIEKVRM